MCSPRKGKTGSVRSGYRHNAILILFIDIRQAMRDGIKFWRSHNDVILTRGQHDNGFLPSRFIRKAEDRYRNPLILFRNLPKEGDYTYHGKEQAPADLVKFWATQQQEEAARVGEASVSAPASSFGLDYGPVFVASMVMTFGAREVLPTVY